MDWRGMQHVFFTCLKTTQSRIRPKGTMYNRKALSRRLSVAPPPAAGHLCPLSPFNASHTILINTSEEYVPYAVPFTKVTVCFHSPFSCHLRHRSKEHSGVMKGEDHEAVFQHAVLVSGVDSRFENNSSMTTSVTSNPFEPRGWGANDNTLLSAGSAANPIEIDDDDGSDPMPPAGTRSSGNAPSTQRRSWQHVVNEGDLSPADQIYGYRGVIQHHGVVTYVPWASGHNMIPNAAPHLPPDVVHVVHFDPCCGGVETTTLEAFLKGGVLRRARYSASNWSASVNIGASYACSADEPTNIIRRATEAAKFSEGISGWSGYCLLTNNCETFAFWCCTGRRQTLSRQASRGLVGAGLLAAGVSAAASVGALASAGATATTRVSAMIPRAFTNVDQAIKAMQWATGVAVFTSTVADALTEKATRAPVAWNRAGGDVMEES